MASLILEGHIGVGVVPLCFFVFVFKDRVFLNNPG